MQQLAVPPVGTGGFSYFFLEVFFGFLVAGFAAFGLAFFMLSPRGGLRLRRGA